MVGVEGVWMASAVGSRQRMVLGVPVVHGVAFVFADESEVPGPARPSANVDYLVPMPSGGITARWSLEEA